MPSSPNIVPSLELTLRDYTFPQDVRVEITDVIITDFSTTGSATFVKADMRIRIGNDAKDTDSCFAASDISDMISSHGYELNSKQKTDIDLTIREIETWCEALVSSGKISSIYDAKTHECKHRLIIKAGE